MTTRSIAIAIGTLLLWLLGPMLFAWFFEDLSGAYAYALVTTWVVVAFAVLLTEEEWRAVPILIFLYVVVFCIAASVGYEGLYREISDVPWRSLIPIALGQAIMIASPLVFAWTFDAFRDRIRKRPSPPAE
jgi:hypothetical protein